MTAFPLIVEILICGGALATLTSYSVHAEFASSPPPSSFVGIVSSGFNTLKIPTLLVVHAGLFGCFHKPPNFDMDNRIVNTRT